jgi:methylmalonyl-CoA/ethylmalonyl-CoA epimerase
MKPEFSKLYQIGMIVENVEEAVKNWEAMGMGPWRFGECDSSKDPFKEMTVDGKKQEFAMKNAFMNAYGLEIELIEPVSDSPYKEWLKEHGPGLHHIAVATETPFAEFLEKTGKTPWIQGECKEIGMNFAYADLNKELGVIVEVYDEDKSATPSQDFDA